MVRTSNCPALVAISVVTFWRNTFSARVTQLTVISGFFEVKSPVRPCMRIMSPLLTVAMVSVVSADAGITDTSANADALKAARISDFIWFLPSWIGLLPVNRANIRSADYSRQGGIVAALQRELGEPG